MKFCNAEVVEEAGVGFDEIGDGEAGESGAVVFSGARIVGRGAGGAVAAAEVVGADDEIFVGVDHFAGADEVFPPAVVEFFSPALADGGDFRIVARDVMSAGKSVENEDDVVFFGVQSAPSFVGEGVAGYGLAIAQGDGFSHTAVGEKLCFGDFGNGFGAHGGRLGGMGGMERRKRGSCLVSGQKSLGWQLVT